MRICFSRDRPAQLDLLLRSIEINMPEDKMFTQCMCRASTPDFAAGYALIDGGNWANIINEADFNDTLRFLLQNADEFVTFFCDDDIVFRPYRYPRFLGQAFEHEQLLTISLRLGSENTSMPHPHGFPCWRWPDLPRSDFGFPASVDGHVFRTADVLRMIGDDPIPNPTMLETVMALRVEELAEERPLMACPWLQCLVGVPVNRVSEQSGVDFGLRFPQPAEELNERWLGGERIALEQLDFSGVAGCHMEIPFVWERRP